MSSISFPIQMRRKDKLSVLEPTSLDLALAQLVAGGQTLSSEVQSNIQTLSLRISFEDVLLATSVLSALQTSVAATLAKRSAGTPLPDISISLPGASTTVAMLAVNVVFGGVFVEFINDLGYSEPLARLRLEGTSFTLEGSTSPLMLAGALKLKIRLDYFNSGISMYEEMLESFPCEITVADFSHAHVSLRVGSPKSCNISISTSLATKCLHIMHALNSATKNEVRLDASRRSSPYRLLNETGCSLQLRADGVVVGDVATNAAFPFSLGQGLTAARSASLLRPIGQEAEPRRVDLVCLGRALPAAVSPRAAVRGVDMGRESSGHFGLRVGADGRAGRASPWAVTVAVECWQYNRRVDLTGRWQAPFMPQGDPTDSFQKNTKHG